MELDLEEVLNIFPWQLDWTNEPGAKPPMNAPKLRARAGGSGRCLLLRRRIIARMCIRRSTRIWLAMPMSRLPWEREREGVLEDGKVVSLREVRRGVSMEEASGAWVWEIVAALGERMGLSIEMCIA
jgi:hypothetical protein